MDSKEKHQIIITQSATDRWQNEVLEYLFEHFSETRIIEIQHELEEKVKSLQFQPARGTIEPNFRFATRNYRFILFKVTRILELKIIYRFSKEENALYILDFFPTKMNPNKMQ